MRMPPHGHEGQVIPSHSAAIFKGFHSAALRAVGILNQTDGSFRDRLRQPDLRHMAVCNGRGCHRLRIKTDAEVALHHGQHLIRGGSLHVHMKGEVVLEKQLLVKSKGADPIPQADKGAGLYILKPPHLGGQILKIRTAEKNFPERAQRGLMQRFFDLKGRYGNGTVHLAAEQSLYSPGGGVVGDAEMNAGVELVEGGKPFQQDQMQSGFAGGNGDAVGFQTAIPAISLSPSRSCSNAAAARP